MSQTSKVSSNQSTTASSAATTTSVSSSGNASNKVIAIANFLNDVSLALRVSETLQDSVYGILREFTEWSTEVPEISIANVKQSIKNIHTVQSKLEKIAAECSRIPDAQPVSLGNTGLVGLDPGEDKSSFYKQLQDAGSWARSVSKEASDLSRELKRKHGEIINEYGSKTRKDDSLAEYKSFYQHLDLIKKDFPDLLIEYDVKKHYCFNIKIKDTLSLVIVLSGTIPHRVIIRAYDEENTDLWTPSRYVVFRKLTDVAQSALLHFFQSSETIHGLKEYLKWLSSYKTLFTAKCVECNKYLQMTGTEKLTFLPPCWRDFVTYKALHLECR